jgi:cell division protein FtsB
MRDISHRLARRRSRFAAPEDPVRRRLRWAWLAVALWLVWIGLLSEHSLWRFARLGSDNARATGELTRTREKVARLEAERGDPERMRERGEKTLRERGGMARKGEIIYQIDDVVPAPPAH